MWVGAVVATAVCVGNATGRMSVSPTCNITLTLDQRTIDEERKRRAIAQYNALPALDRAFAKPPPGALPPPPPPVMRLAAPAICAGVKPTKAIQVEYLGGAGGGGAGGNGLGGNGLGGVGGVGGANVKNSGLSSVVVVDLGPDASDPPESPDPESFVGCAGGGGGIGSERAGLIRAVATRLTEPFGPWVHGTASVAVAAVRERAGVVATRVKAHLAESRRARVGLAVAGVVGTAVLFF